MAVRKDWPDIFLARLSKLPNVAAAARAAKVTRQAAYLRRENDPEFAQAWDEALAVGLDVAEGELYRRAVKGTKKPVYQGGKLVGSVTEFSDTLLIFLLKSHKPEVYRDTIHQELTGKDGGPVESRNAQVHIYIPDNFRG